MSFLKAPVRFFKSRSRSPSPSPSSRMGGFVYRQDRDEEPESSKGKDQGSSASWYDEPQEPPPEYSEKETQPRVVEKGKKEWGSNCKKQYEQLKYFDVRFIINDSASMNTRLNDGRRLWDEAISIFMQAADVAKEYNDDGIGIYCINHVTDYDLSDGKKRYKTEKDIKDELKTITEPKAMQSLHFKLCEILERYMKCLRAEVGREARGEDIIGYMERLNLIIITHDSPAKEAEMEKTIVDYARELTDLGRSQQIGIQFVQIGNDREVKRYLTGLDTLHERYTEIPDIVDTVPCDTKDGQISEEMCSKILLGVIRNVDEKKAKSSKDEGPSSSLLHSKDSQSFGNPPVNTSNAE